MNEIIESKEYTKAVVLTNRIKANAVSMQESLWEVCRGLKEMHDSKLYKELGYGNFEEYTEKEIGIKRHQAQKYLAIAEFENGDSNHHFAQLGVTKLALLAKLDEPQREEIQQKVDMQTVTVKELQSEIEKLKNVNAGYEKKLSNSETEISKLEDELIACRAESADTVQCLEKQIEELKNRPIDVAVADNSHEIENMRKAMSKLDLEYSKEISDLQESNIKEIRQLNDQHREEIEALKKEYESKLKTVPESKGVPDNKAVFKAYLSIAVDASKRLAEFIKENPDELFISKTKELFTKILKEI